MVCTEKVSVNKKKDPIYNFEVFAQTFEKHYAFFELNTINWDSLYTTSKTKITPKTSDAELYLILKDIVDKLQDNHGYIEPTESVYEAADKLRPVVESTETEGLKEYGDFQISQMAFDAIVEEDLTKGSWLINWGKLKDTIGFIEVKSLWLYADLHLSDSLVKANGFVDSYVTAFNQLNEGEYIEKERKGVASIYE